MNPADARWMLTNSRTHFRTLIALAIIATALFVIPAGASAVPLPTTINVSPATTTLPDQNVNGTGQLFNVTVTNSISSASSWTYTGATFTKDSGEGFYIWDESGCNSVTLVPGASCVVQFAFAPVSTGDQQATFTPNTNGATTVGTASMSGKAISPFVDVDQTGHYFGAVDINGGTSPTFDLDLSNTGTGSAKLTNFALGGMTPDQFSLDLSDCGGGPTVTLTGNSSCTAVITFAPDVADDAETLLSFDTDDLIHDSYSVEFYGYGAEQQLHSQNGNGFFVPRAVGSGPSPAETFTYDNPGSLVTSIDSVSLTGADASQFSISSDGCTPSLADGDECDVDVKFSPTSAGSKSVNLHVVYNHSLDSVDVPIDADAIQLELSSSTGSLAFNSQLANSGASAAQSIHLDNNGFLTTPVNSLTVTGADASSFAITSQDCTPSVAGGDSCAAQITFNPTSAGAKSASLHVVFDSPRGSLDVPISGTATSPAGSDPGSNPGGSAPTPRLFADGAPPAALKKLTGFTFAVGCGTACKVSAAATVSFKAKVGKKFKSKKITATGTASPAAGATATLSLKFKPADIKLFKGGKSGSVKVTFTAPGMTALTLPLKLK